MPLMFRAVWKSAVFFKAFLKESEHENASNNFCSVFFCIYTHTLKRQLSATKTEVGDTGLQEPIKTQLSFQLKDFKIKWS